MLIIMHLGVNLLGSILFGALCPSWTWLSISFPSLGKLLAIIASKMFPAHFFLFSFWDPYIKSAVSLEAVVDIS